MPNTRAATRRATLSVAVALLVLGVAALAVYAANHSKSSRHVRAKVALAGSVRKPLRPGASQPIDLVLTNRNGFAVSVTRLKVSVSVRPRTRGAKCSVRRDFAVSQLGRRAYPVRLAARSHRSLTRLHVRSRLLPRITMRDLRYVNQDDCKRAAVRLRYTVRVRRALRRVRHR